MQSSMPLFTFSVLDGIQFLGKLCPKNQNCQFKLKFGTYTNSNKQNSVALFCFRPETLFLGKYGPKNQICQFKLKFGTYINSNIQNSMMVFITRKTLFGKRRPIVCVLMGVETSK